MCEAGLLAQPLQEKVRQHHRLQVILVINMPACAVHDTCAERDALIVHDDARVAIKVGL